MLKDIKEYFGKNIENKEVFNKHQINGLEIVEKFITKEEEILLLQYINNSTWDTSLCRRTQHYGYRYNYGSSTKSKADKIPEWCNFLLKRLNEKLGINFEQLIINEYKPGQGIAPHTDHKMFGSHIVSISLGSEYIMNFENTEDKHYIRLKRCSLLIMSGDARYKWKHSITPRISDNGVKRNTRVSLTFRTMK